MDRVGYDWSVDQGRRVVNTVGDRVGDQGGRVVSHGVSHHGGVVHSVVSHGGGGVGGGGGVVGGLGVRLSLVADVGDEAVLVVGVVGHDLDAAVRQLHAVLACNTQVVFTHSTHYPLYYTRASLAVPALYAEV